MSEKNLRVGQLVAIGGKEAHGRIAYIGMTTFAVGKWVGVVFDEPVGKNNGTIKGTAYFTCPENHGMFVRPTQVQLLDDAGNPMETSLEEPRLQQPRSRLSSAGSVRSVASARPTTVRRKSPVKAPHSVRQSLNMTSSNCSSRQSLAGSRQSLIGSRSQLASPATERAPPSQLDGPASATMPPPSTSLHQPPASQLRPPSDKKPLSPPDSGATPKRESFVETGFLETLKPQFTPGFSLSSSSTTAASSLAGGGSSTADDKLHAQPALVDELQAQVRDLTEKLDTVRQRRAEDKERLRDFDRMRTQFDQLNEFKTRIMDAQSQLQRDLQRARQETRDAVEARDQHADEMSELAENVEMITLDKEMAEERADTLQLELEAARERCEELQLDLEILKEEVKLRSGAPAVIATGGEKGADGDGVQVGGGVSSFEFKQMEQQNARLRETLVRLRDLSAHEKHELQKLTKELETSKSEVLELHRTKEKLSATIDQLEAQQVDLQEQVDAALGAEEMVEQLADRKMELEDRVRLLEEEVAELEALEEVHELLVEGNRELELDLREELDMALAAKRDMVREKDAAIETCLDRDQTILKFRELVQRLNEQITELREARDAGAEASASLNSSGHRFGSPAAGGGGGGVDAMDFKQMFAESRAYTRAIDLQIRQIELGQATEHVRLLVAYMPDTFMGRGSDHDAILVWLLVGRLVRKAEIIVGQARERFAAVEAVAIDRNAVLQAHAVHQFAFQARLLYQVGNLLAVMHQFEHGLAGCDAEALLRAGAAMPEMVAQEKCVDGIVELLRANQLDENSSTDNLEKCVAFFNAMYSVLISNAALCNQSQLLRDSTASMSAACDSIHTDARLMQALLAAGAATADAGPLLQFAVEQTDALKQQLKLIRRRVPAAETGITTCGLSEKTFANLRGAAEQLGRLMAAMHAATKLVLAAVAASDDVDATVDDAQLGELLGAAFERVYEQDDRGPAANLRGLLGATCTEMAQLAQYLLDNEYEIMSGGSGAAAATAAAAAQKRAASAAAPPAPAPLAQRAQFVKQQLEQTKTLTANLENREADIRQLKLTAKLKQSELSEMQIRKDLAEKKLSVLQHDHEANAERLQRRYDETLAELRRKEKEFEETMDHLQNDIESLESERGQLREKLKGYGSRKGELSKSRAFDITAGSPDIAQELGLLKRAFADERRERLRLQAEEMRKTLARLAPIHVPTVQRDERLAGLERELAQAKRDYIMSLATGAEFPRANTAHASMAQLLAAHEQRKHAQRQQIRRRVDQLASSVMAEYLERKPHRAAAADTPAFPSAELTRAMRAGQ